MADLNFPNSPTDGQIYTVGNRSWAWSAALGVWQGGAAAVDLSGMAALNSPVFTGTPSLPTGTTSVTQSPGDNTTKIATTAFVTAATPAATASVTGLARFATPTQAQVSTPLYALDGSNVWNILGNRIRYYDIGWGTDNKTGTASSALYNAVYSSTNLLFTTGATAGSTVYRQTAWMQSPGTGTSNCFLYNQEMSFTIDLTQFASSANGVFRACIGGGNFLSAMDAIGFGFDIRGTRLWLVWYIGSTAYSYDTGTDLYPIYGPARLTCYNDGVGGLSLWNNGTQLGSTQSATFSGAVAGQASIGVRLINGADAVTNQVVVNRLVMLRRPANS